MNKVLFLLGISVGLFLFACNNQSKTKDKITSVNPVSQTVNCPVPKNKSGAKGKTCAGYEYVHHVSNNTTKPKVGDQVKYHKLVFKNDTSLLQSTFYLLEPRADILISRDSVPKPPNPVYDALFLMSPGDSLTVVQQLDTFPKERLPKDVTNEDYFTYHIKMLDIKPKAALDKELKDLKARHVSITDSLRTFIKDFKAGKLDKHLTSTETGLRYYVNKEGNGKKVKDGGFVKVHYLGMLEDGTLFDGTYHKAKPFPFRVGRGQVIDGWDEGIPKLSLGGEGTFVVPYQSAYGIAGRPPAIPQRADLYFYVSLVGIY